MNCKQGDLAFVVKLFSNPKARYGEIVECLELANETQWHIRFRGQTHWENGERYLCRDEVLRPIRDPGDDATDEMVARLGTPMQRQLNALEREIDLLNKSLDRLDKVLTQQPERG